MSELTDPSSRARTRTRRIVALATRRVAGSRQVQRAQLDSAAACDIGPLRFVDVRLKIRTSEMLYDVVVAEAVLADVPGHAAAVNHELEERLRTNWILAAHDSNCA